MVSTPCIKIRTMDPRAGICAGCGRTLEEIARWGGMAESERLRIIELLPARLEKAKQTV
jgi:predicted Fe-S protein YdhL (DUF1289 family)